MSPWRASASYWELLLHIFSEICGSICRPSFTAPRRNVWRYGRISIWVSARLQPSACLQQRKRTPSATVQRLACRMHILYGSRGSWQQKLLKIPVECISTSTPCPVNTNVKNDYKRLFRAEIRRFGKLLCSPSVTDEVISETCLKLTTFLKAILVTGLGGL
jgi:hypothetical protein